MAVLTMNESVTDSFKPWYKERVPPRYLSTQSPLWDTYHTWPTFDLIRILFRYSLGNTDFARFDHQVEAILI